MGLFDGLKAQDSSKPGVKLDSGDELLTRKQVCELLKVNAETVRLWEKQGRITAYYLTPGLRERPEDYRGKRYKKSEVEKLIQP